MNHDQTTEHDFTRSRFTGTTTCSRCGLLPMDEDDLDSPCVADDEE